MYIYILLTTSKSIIIIIIIIYIIPCYNLYFFVLYIVSKLINVARKNKNEYIFLLNPQYVLWYSYIYIILSKCQEAKPSVKHARPQLQKSAPERERREVWQNRVAL
jgi:hypothetical protein